MPAVQKLPPELCHNLAVKACKYGIFGRTKTFHDPESLKTNLLGLSFENPIGIAAGFDKQGEAVQGLHNIGFGFVEIGSVTPEPQAGNPEPRVFRLIEDKAIINRYGFNSDGHLEVHRRLTNVKNDPNFKGILGVNLGKNKTSESAVDDYVSGVNRFGPFADYLVVNISSPNTPGLRNLQKRDDLKLLLSAIKKARDDLPFDNKPPILLKLAPDLSSNERNDIADVLKRKDCKIDGLIISNTTIDRSNLINTEFSNEIGGLSGAPITEKSTQMIAEMYKLTKGQIPIIGVGGVFTGEDAYQKVLAGASLIQIYTSFIYHGPPIVSKIKSELDECLRKNGYENLKNAVGKENKTFLK